MDDIDADRPDLPPDSLEPHAFRTLGDNWMGEGVPPGPSAGGANVVGAALEFGDRECAVCGRPESDPIHAPIED